MTRILAALSANALPLAVPAAAFTVAVGLPAGDPDMWWHLASGRWMVEHGEGLRVDVFSSTATGEPYALGEWLGEIVLYQAYAAWSWTGVAILRAALVALASFAIARLALRYAPARVAIPLAVLAVMLSKPTWTDRPQLFTLALFPVLLDLCLAARAGSRAALVATVPLTAVWANLHGGYALGIAILFAFAVEAILERRPVIGPLTAAALATFVVSLEPGALSLTRAIGHVAGSTVRIVEESPVDPLTPFGALFALFVGATIAVLMVRGGSLLSVIVLVPMLWLALSAQRHIPLFGSAAVPFLVGPLTVVLGEIGTTLKRVVAEGFPRPLGRRTGPSASRMAAATGGEVSPSGMYVNWGRSGPEPGQFGPETHAAAEEEGRADRTTTSSKSFSLAPAIAPALWLGALASIATADPRPDLKPYPVGADAALASSSGILFNEYDWGGYLIWSVPSRPVFVDGRLYPFAGNGIMRSYEDAIHVLPSWRAVIERWGVAQALIRPDRALVQALLDEGWTVRAQGESFVLLERPR